MMRRAAERGLKAVGRAVEIAQRAAFADPTGRDPGPANGRKAVRRVLKRDRRFRPRLHPDVHQPRPLLCRLQAVRDNQRHALPVVVGALVLKRQELAHVGHADRQRLAETRCALVGEN